MIWLFLVCAFVNGIIMDTLDAGPVNSWQWWVSVLLFGVAHMAGYYNGKKHKEENNNA